jgi:cytochrome c biogenesis protein CcmG/thiol:disulfide interchange protein DsbE
MKFLVAMLMLIALVAPSLGTASAQSADSKESLKSLPEVHLRDFNGKPIKAASLKGSVYIFDFWATWCGPCIKEIPVWNQLQAKYGAQGLKVVGVTLASGEASEVKPFVTKNNMKYTVLMGDDDQTYDLNIIGFPMTYVLTSDMKVYSKYIGASAQKAAKIEADVQEILKRQTNAAAKAASDH